MEQGFDKEIHSLLRRARGGADSRPATEGNGASTALSHLDADEMSAYAEGVLPSAARVAAAAHLADCEECRGVVVGLVRAAGVEAALEKSPAPEPSTVKAAKAERSWRERMGALFAPRVMAYVAPLLAVCLVGAVAFVALRSRESAPEVAREASKENNARVGITSANQSTTAQPQEAGAGTTVEQAPAVNQNAAAKDAASVARTEVTTTGPVAPADEKRDAAAPAGELSARQVAELPVVQPAPAPVAQPVQNSPAAGAAAAAAPPKSEPAGNEATRAGSAAGQLREDVTVVGRADQTQNRAANNQTNAFEIQSPDGSRAQRRAGSPRSAAPPAADAAEAEDSSSDSAKEKDRAKSRRSVGEAIRMGRGRTETKPEERSDADERTAAGHRFRREGGAWVDVNYKPSMSQTGVRRDTEAFRALVADVPEVGRAAQQLSGEFIIVLRGRAYRVRP